MLIIILQIGPSLVHCQQDSFIKTFESEVIDCKEWTSPIDDKRKGKGGKKKKKGKNKKQQKVYEIELKDTILFPEGGGQPTDNGTLTIISDDNKEKDKQDVANILSVYRTDKGRVLHKSNTELNVGTKVNISLNWDRRYDHMQQHSGQHLISAVFRNTLNTPTISWWMSEYPKSSQIEMKIDTKSQDKEITNDI